jgi:hypothetical protein
VQEGTGGTESWELRARLKIEEEFDRHADADDDDGTEGSGEGNKEYPEYSASLWSRLTFNWISPLIKYGYKHPLQDRDIWRLATRDKTSEQAEAFVAAWADEVARVDALNGGSGVDDAARLLRRQGSTHKASVSTDKSNDASVLPSPQTPSLTRVIFAVWKRPFFVGFLYKILNDGAIFAGPVFLKLLIEFMNDETEEEHIGYIYAFALFFSQLVGAFGENQYFQRTMRVALHVRSSLTGTLFTKAMTMTHDTRGEVSNGKKAVRASM